MPRSGDPQPRPVPGLEVERVRRARRRLLAHYDRTARDLPWRRTSDPYAIWVSEVMLQQTRVDTVRDRWVRFLDRFPDVWRLARAHEASVLKAWEGLGYYARARNLRRAAQAVVRDHHGALPRDPKALRALPGFGPYVIGAVSSIAFGRRMAAVDGNVLRVLARYLDERGSIGEAVTRRRIQEVAERLVPPGRPGDWNQALMELGATLCRSRRPSCAGCPLMSDCEGRRAGSVEDLPRRPARPTPVPHHQDAAGLIRRGGCVLVVRRPSDGLLGGLWELPSARREAGESLAETCVRGVSELAGLSVSVAGPLGALRQAYSHFRVTLHVFEAAAPRGRPLAQGGAAAARFASPRDLTRLAFSRVHRRALEKHA